MTQPNEYLTSEHALAYLAKSDRIPHRAEGESVLLELLPPAAESILDVGCGDGRLMALIKLTRPHVTGIALDFSPVMLEKARERFRNDPNIEIVEHDLSLPLPELGRFDAIVSSLAIHHLDDVRKRRLYGEIFQTLRPGGTFCNLEHVASPSETLHAAFYEALGESLDKEDPSNRLVTMNLQLEWLREIGFQDVDCFWKWRELALLAGKKERC